MFKKIRFVSLFTALFIMPPLLLAGCGNNEEQSTKADLSDVKIQFLSVWQGESAVAPSDLENNPVAKVIKEKTGVTVDFQFNTVSEMEKLNVLFASGELPDLISCPFWGGSDAATLFVKKVAREGMLAELDPYIDTIAPGVKPAFSQGVALDLKRFDLEDPAFGGKHYIIPVQVPATSEDVVNTGDTLYVRGDIYKALPVNPDTLKTSEDLYQLLKKIKEGNFKDINGKDVIVGGTWHNGNGSNNFYATYNSARQGFTGYGLFDGKIMDDLFNPLLDKRILFMRKLLSEGLLDLEMFNQNAARAQEKVVRGSVAVIGSKYSDLSSKLQGTLYKTNPEMKYVPLPLLTNADGEKGKVLLKGSGGCPVLIVPKTSKKIEATMKLLNYLASEEGKLLISYGIEGVHYKMVNGQPRLTDEWLEKYKEDPKNLYNEGIRGVYDRFLLLNSRLSKYGEMSPGDAESKDPEYEKAKEMSPIIDFVEGIRVNYFENDYSKIESIRSLKSNAKINDAIQRAYFAENDEQALKIVNDFRDQLMKEGIGELFNYVQEKSKGESSLLY